MAILLLGLRCCAPECGRKWATTLQAYRNHPGCPFCGHHETTARTADA